jgi:hypothetical protein
VEAMAPMGRLLRQHPRTKASKAAAQSRLQHAWVWHCDRRLCQRCGIMPRRQDCSSYRVHCPGHISGHSQVHASHKMRHTTVLGAEFSLVFCKSCGSYGQSRFAKLRQVCPGRPSAATRTMHKRLLQGKHPLTQVPLAPHIAWRPPPPRCRQHFEHIVPHVRLPHLLNHVVAPPMQGLHPLTQVPLQPHVRWQCTPPLQVPTYLAASSGRPPAADLAQHRSPAADTQAEELARQLDDLAGLERGSVQAVQTADDSSDEDVFAHGFALDEP